MGHTTTLIRKRIRHWKTSLAGLVPVLAPIASIIWPQHSKEINSVAIALCGAGLFMAADAKHEPEQPK